MVDKSALCATMVDKLVPSWSTEVAVDLAEVKEAYADLLKASTPTAIMQRLDELKMATDIAIDNQVVEAMLDPFSHMNWTRLGDVFGISRQAAHKRWFRKVDAEMSRQLHARMREYS